MKPHLTAKFLLHAATALLALGCDSHRATDNTVRIRWGRDPETLDPLFLPNQASVDANNLLHLSLLQSDISKHAVVPALADSLPRVQFVGDSLTRITYRIRPAATWDNGLPVLASDVVFTLKLMFCPGLPNEAARIQYGFIRGILPHPQDPKQFTLLCRGRAIDYAQSSGDFFVLPEAAVDPRGQLRSLTLADLQRPRPALATDSALLAVAQRYQKAVGVRSAARLPGCGPYELTRWEKDRYLTFRRKPHWWGSKLPAAPLVLQARPEQLEYAIIPDVTAAALALRRGEVDVYPQVPARVFSQLRASPAARAVLQFYNTPSYDVAIAGFNTRRHALADALTRRALSQCFDAAGLLAATQLGEGQRTVGIISPSDRPNYNDSLPLLPFAPAMAAALLQQAGWRRGPAASDGWVRADAKGRPQQLRLQVRYRTDDALFATAALQFQAAAASIGVAVALQPTEAGAFTTAIREGDFDVCLRMLKGNPFMFNFAGFLHSSGIGAGNVTGFATPASDHLIDAIAAAGSVEQRARLLRRFQALLQAEAPLVPLFFLSNRLAAQRNLTGLHVGRLKPGFTAATIERRPPAASAP